MESHGVLQRLEKTAGRWHGMGKEGPFADQTMRESGMGFSNR